MKFLEQKDINTLVKGKHEINGNCFALVNEYETTINSVFTAENHIKYIDLQLIVRGEETIKIADTENFKKIHRTIQKTITNYIQVKAHPLF